MTYGLGTKHAKPKDKKADNKAKSGNRSDEAAEMLKKMQAKKDAGSCAFC